MTAVRNKKRGSLLGDRRAFNRFCDIIEKVKDNDTGILSHGLYRTSATSLIKHGCTVGQYEVSAFADGERRYHLKGEAAGQSVAIVASVLPAPESLFDLLALHRLLRENGAADLSRSFPTLVMHGRTGPPTGEMRVSVSWSLIFSGR